jgi:polysaccharide biosynthesis protein PslH
VPATIFVCSGAVGRRQEFWWDQLERALLRSPEKLPARLELDIDGKRMTWSLEEDDRLGDGHDWRARHPLPHAVSRSLFYSVWEHLRDLPPAAQADAMRQIRLWSGIPNEARWDYRTLDADDLVKMADSRLITIGAHTVNHPLLPAHPREFRRLEISNGRTELQDIIGRPVRHFAYPYGGYDHTTVDILREESFASACTTVDRATTPRSLAHELPRVTVHDWTSEQFRTMIREKLSDRDAIFGAFAMQQAPYPFIFDKTKHMTLKLKNKTVLIIHPAWHSCGSHAVFCSQSKAYKALGAKVISLAVGSTLSYHSSNHVFWNSYYSRTTDLVSDARFHTGPSRLALTRPSSISAILRNLFTDYAQQRAVLANISPIQPELFASDIALVHCNHYFNMPIALRLRAIREMPILLETHDVQARQYELRGAKALFRNRPDSFERLLKSELSHCAMADYLIHINTDEMSLFSDRLPGKPHALLYPCISVSHRCGPVLAEITRAERFFLIVASGNYPNFLSVKWFLTDVMPLIQSVNVKIVGNVDLEFSYKAPDLYNKYKDIFVGPVNNLSRYYCETAAVLIPTIEGHGLSIKTVEAMATNRTIIATPRAFRGIDIDFARISNVQVVESAADFAAAVMAQWNSATPQINDNALVSRVLGIEKFDAGTKSSKTSQQIVAELFSFEHYLEELGAIIERVLQ